MISIEGEKQTTNDHYKNKKSKTSIIVFFNIPEVKHQHCVFVIEEHHNLGLPSVIWLVDEEAMDVGALVDEGLLVLEVLVTTGVVWDDEWWDWT